MPLERDVLVSRLQYTNVSPAATREDIVRHCEKAAAYGFQAVMLHPCWITLARDILRGTTVRVATAIAYPMGGETTTMKVAMVQEVVRLGADEFDFQPNIGFLRSGMLDAFESEIRLIVEASEGRPAKSMSEFGFLDDEEKILCLQLAERAGVAYVKNSSGIGPGGSPATPEVIRFIKKHLEGRARIKASGGVRGYEQAIALLDAGASLLGSSAAPEIVEGGERIDAGY
jgi:deoxyribose-phosphate aldolase